MKHPVAFLLFLLSVIPVLSQTRIINNTSLGRSFTTENIRQTNLPLLQKAAQQIKLLSFEETMLTLESAIAQNPNSAAALLQRARLKRITGMYMEADQDFQLAHRINPFAADLYGYRGNNGLLNILSVDVERSIQDLNTFQKLNYYYEFLDSETIGREREDQEYQQLEIIIENIENTSLDQALKRTNEVIDNFPNSAIAYDLKGMILMKMKQFDLAAAAITKATELEPNFAIAWYNLGQIKRIQGYLSEAKIYLDKAISIQENLTKAYFERALLYKSMGEKEKALTDYDQIININGGAYLEVFLNRGLTKKVIGDFTGAFNDLNHVIARSPRNAALFKNRGNLYMLFGQPKKAIEDYTKAIQINGEYKEAYYNRALAHFLNYDNISACADLEESVRLGYEKAAAIQKYFCGA